MNPDIRSKYEVVIGIETHVQLATKTKLFCGCDNDSRDAEPNTHVCEVCLGLPGALPVLNKHAVELAIRLGLALNTKYPPNYHTKFDRKNYFYPDLPKGYQITQFDEPIVPHGYVEFPFEDGIKRIGVTRAHLEDDAGKLTHPEGSNESLVDLNRAGTPLVEIVSEPDMRTAAEAKAYAQELHNIVRYANVSNANLYYGNMRFDVNVSVRLFGAPEFGTRTETKNLNSFKAIERTVEYEIRRQIVLVEHGDKVRQETRGWNDEKQETYAMRSKEDADEYRYFPEPDLPPLVITESLVSAARNELGLLPVDVRRELEAAKLPAVESEVLVSYPTSARLWHEVITLDPKQARFALNWLTGDAVKLAEESRTDIADSGISPQVLATTGQLIVEGKLSSTNAKQLLSHVWEIDSNDLEIETLATERGLIQESNVDELGKVVDEVITANPQAVSDYRNGNERAFGALVGQAMKATGGKGNPPVINKLLHERLDNEH
jgi:aspartyl-tRNA(Asn)/glutamyl-tRNA(Gln) amidotransferase subunit B